MEYLYRSLKQLRYIPDFNYHPRCNKMEIVHICFGDDLIMCCRADVISVKLMMKQFNHFSKVSGLKANLEKSSLYVAGVNSRLKNQILEEMQFSEGEIPFRYLGVPLSSKKITVQQCLPLVERMTARIRCWSTKYLAYSGRVQLIKGVLFEMQTYWAQTGNHESSRGALVAWETLCKPYSAGGLNFIEFHTWNKAALSKLLWAVAVKKDSLWIKWIHTFYIKGKDIQQMTTLARACWIVRKILDAKKRYLNKDLNAALQDCCITGKFRIKKAYQAFLPQNQKLKWRGLVLGSKTIPKHKFILWLALMRRLAIVDRIQKWGVNVQTDCVLCSTGDEETLQHLFFQCSYSAYIWNSILQWLGEKRKISNWEEETEWISRKTRNSRPRAQILLFLYAATVYHLWSERNIRRFQDKKREGRQILKEIVIQLHTRGQQFSKWRRVLESLNSYPK
ncbi:PREDICTED: uncharacterized protein LOC109207404 [Nicotiana attenuata]|uniref:uncharacterized protein LOC109207404 n=1 Tax=Nicotiana attenuata TaxID=49451 RepID=UPI0009057FA3|nr:PREDICTED: uncharacterized protein LOC109207404 [Nicotiana attenuata]